MLDRWRFAPAPDSPPASPNLSVSSPFRASSLRTSRSHLSRRHFLRQALLVGGALAGGALSQGCQIALPIQPSASTPEGCSPRGSAAAKTPLPTVSISAIEPVAGAPTGNPAISHVVVIVLDGMMPEYMSTGSFPNLERLLGGGTSFSRSWVGQVANNTPVSHVSLASGQLPYNTGVVYFGWRDPLTRKMVRLNSTNLDAGVFADLMHQQGVQSIARVLKQHRPGAKVAAVGSTKDFAPVNMALDSADVVGYAVRISAAEAGLAQEREITGDDKKARQDAGGRKKDKDAGAEVNNEEATVPVRKLVPGGPAITPLPADLLCDPAYQMVTREVGDNDIFAGNLAVGVFDKVRPELLMVNLPDNDQIGHLTGGVTTNPRAVGRVMSVADAQVGRLIEAYQRAGLYDKTLWVILSDHGMTPNSVNILPTYVDKVLSDADIQRIGGDTAHYWLKDQNENRIAAELIDEHDAEGFVGTYFKVEQSNGHFVYEPTKVVERHLTGRMRAAVEFLHDTFASPQGPDLALVLAEAAHFQNKPLNTAGSHSEATWELQKIPIWFNGPGVRSGLVSPYPARIVDIAPTILTLLGLPVPPEMNGVVLQDVLASSSQEQRDQQLNSPETQRLIRHQDVLIEMSSLGRKLDQG